MEQIKSLYDGINFVTIPNVLLDELKKISNQRSYSSSRGTDGKMKTTYGEKMEPLFIYFSEYNFYLNDFYYNELFKKIDLEVCFDENGIKINRENIKSFFTEYGKGFVKGYNEFERNTTKSNSLFTETNEQISYKIYSRIKEHFIYNKNGNFKTPIKNEKVVPNINFTFLFKKKNFFESGFNGGEFYKAWEIILNNPTIFEPIFIKANIENDKTKKEKSSEISKNPFPHIFINENIYNCFIEYIEKHILEFYSDISYLKKRLEKEKLIHYHKDNNFVKFLFENKFITQSNYENYFLESKLKSLNKSFNIQRENNFNNVFSKFINH
jgi:hypothetical protein